MASILASAATVHGELTADIVGEGVAVEIALVAGRIDETAADAIVVNLFEGVTTPGGATGAVDQRLGGMIAQVIAAGDFRGKLNEVLVLYPASAEDGALAASRVLVVGLGKQDEFTLDRVRQVAAAAARRARDLGAKHVATILHGGGIGGVEPHRAAQALAEGSLLGLYRFLAFQSVDVDDEDGDERRREVERLTVVELDEPKVPAIQEGLTQGEVIANAVCWARDLVSRPGNDLTPRAFAAAAASMADNAGLRCTVLDRDQIEAAGMGVLLGVARGSAEPPAFIIVEHAPEGTADQAPLVLIGKGVTFDSGGISIKPVEGMEEMKDDMAGGAAVLGAMQAIGRLGIPVRTIALVPATENLPGGRAVKPGDILRALDGTTIEVINTDAEGRLILADAVAFAQRYQPAAIIDLATLTGACIVALGDRVAGVLGSSDDLTEEVRRAAEAAGERMWQLPSWDDVYQKQLKSDVADIKNTGGRAAGTITGGLFIKRFAKDVPWAHLDIAGPAWAKDDGPYTPKGATGFGVRTLVEIAQQRAGS